MRGSDVKARLDMIVDIADHAMQANIDYGKVPGTDKPSLWQAGADKLCVAFQVAPKVRSIEEIGHGDEKAYRVVVVGVHQGTGVELGEGAGECSSNEEKYRYRYSVHQNEWNSTPEDLRRLKFKRDGSTIQQIRTNPADVANTVLKMAVKRAKVAMVLAVTGAAAIFTQDVEDLAEELREQLAGDGTAKPEPRQPQRASSTGGKSNGAKAAPSNQLFVVGVVAKVYDNKAPYAVVLKGQNGREVKFTFFDDALLTDVKQFAGTSHRVKLGYTTTEKNGATYHNAHSIAIHEEAPAAPAAAPAPVTEQPTASDIFGGREPGSDD